MTDILGTPTFDDFWRAYPRRVGRGAAVKSWEKMTKALKIDPADIMRGVHVYAAAMRGKDIQYVAHATTWLNQQRWLDDHSTAVASDEPAYKQDEAAVGLCLMNKRAQELKRQLLQRTREIHAERLHDAAQRLGSTEAELWDCMTPGGDGFERKVWAAVRAHLTAGDPLPEAIAIDREHWLSGRDRLETRMRCISAKQALTG
jgi:hypothetical protein